MSSAKRAAVAAGGVQGTEKAMAGRSLSGGMGVVIADAGGGVP